MRLIDAVRLELCSFVDESQLPPYAILSHTWGGDEVTLEQFRDMHSRDGHGNATVKVGHGLWKISKACQQALNDGLTYVWVDTCCIDKSSSAELSEAINSMFRWYQMAEVCYAYLDDVQIFLEPGVNGVLLSDERFSEDELARSRWFTRGWTLQELVAPNEVVFYGKGWKYMDTKSWLREPLERITGISADVLWDSTQLEDESIAQRMSWMARRETTRVEDIAYSLMGIFDVNMPLLYGEGEKAFTRLQEEIMKDSVDHSLFAWNAQPPSDNFKRSGSVELTSIFATHISQFAESSGFRRRRFDDADSNGESYSLTNMGVRIKLGLQPYEHPTQSAITEMHDDLFMAILDCRYQDNTALRNCRPAILVQQLSPIRPQFVRIANAGIVPVIIPEINDELAHLGVMRLDGAIQAKTIYLRKKIPGWVQGRVTNTLTKAKPTLNKTY
jgi:hypothetical protein